MSEKENKLCMRVAIEIFCRLDSPLLISNGEDERTDSDQMVTADGTPFIPGSALAGALRSYLEKTMGRCEAEDLFGTLGWIQQSEEERKEAERTVDRQSRIFVYDALLKDGRLVHRDGVRLSEGKTSKENMKFDMEAVETGACFNIRLEILIREKDIEFDMETALKSDLEKIRCIVSGMEHGTLRLGARGHRGFGKIKIHWAGYRVFHMDCLHDFEEWLDWNWNDETGLCGANEKYFQELGSLTYAVDEHSLKIPLRIRGTLLVRDYGTPAWSKVKDSVSENSVAENSVAENSDSQNSASADCGQLTLSDGTAVIPGSTWAGAVRSYIAGLVRQLSGFDTWEQAQRALEPFWGTWAPGEKEETGENVKTGEKGKTEGLRASKIVIDETRISGGHGLQAQRNSVDRFTGGSAKGALFEEILWTGGNVNLTIHWSDRGLSEQESKALCGMLMWAVQGLKDGFLAVGGETGVGRGLFEPDGDVELDGRTIQEEKTYLMAAAQWCRQRKGGES